MKGAADAAHGTADDTLRGAGSTTARAEVMRAGTSRFAEKGLKGQAAGRVDMTRQAGRGHGHGWRARIRGAWGLPGAGFRTRIRTRERGRMNDAGEIRLVILRLLSSEPSYGYRLIKTMEARLGGGVPPSAGVVYPADDARRGGPDCGQRDQRQEGLRRD